MDEQQDRKTRQGPIKLGRRGKGGGMIPKESETFSRGGRAGLKGGGICKRGMNRQAIGKNS